MVGTDGGIRVPYYDDDGSLITEQDLAQILDNPTKISTTEGFFTRASEVDSFTESEAINAYRLKDYPGSRWTSSSKTYELKFETVGPYKYTIDDFSNPEYTKYTGACSKNGFSIGKDGTITTEMHLGKYPDGDNIKYNLIEKNAVIIDKSTTPPTPILKLIEQDGVVQWVTYS